MLTHKFRFPQQPLTRVVPPNVAVAIAVTVAEPVAIGWVWRLGGSLGVASHFDLTGVVQTCNFFFTFFSVTYVDR